MLIAGNIFPNIEEKSRRVFKKDEQNFVRLAKEFLSRDLIEKSDFLVEN